VFHKRMIATAVFAAAATISLAPLAAGASGGSGSLDPTFGRGGFTEVPQQVYSVNDVRVDQSGNIVVAVDFAGLGNAIGGFGIARLRSDGTLDSGFGSGGIAVAEFTSGFNVAMSTATQSDGKVIAVGTSRTLPGGVDTMAIARFTQTGGLDAQFGSAGRISPVIPGASQSAAGTVMSLADGKILVGGSAVFSTGPAGIVLRLRSNGSLDPTFGVGGVVNTGLGGINGLGLQSGGKIVTLSGTQARRFLANGTPDANQTRGTLAAETHVGTSELTTNERIVAVFDIPENGSRSDVDTQTMRFFPNGTADGTFVSPLFDYIVTNPDTFENDGQALAIQSAGAICVRARMGVT